MFPGFPYMCLPLAFPGLSMPVFTGFSLLVSQSGCRRLVVSGCPDIFLDLSPFICFPLWLVVSGCPDVFSLQSLVSHHVSLTIFLRIYISVSQFSCLQSSVCLSGGVWFFCLFALSFIICFWPCVSHVMGLPVHMFPYWRCPVLVSARFHVWLVLYSVLVSLSVFLFSQELHQHRFIDPAR